MGYLIVAGLGWIRGCKTTCLLHRFRSPTPRHARDVRLAWREFLPWVGESPLATNRRNRLVTAVLAVLSGSPVVLVDR